MRFDPKGNVSVQHPRQAWNRECAPTTLVHCSLKEMKGTTPGTSQRRNTLFTAYKAAKLQFNEAVALEIVESCVRDTVIDKIIDVIEPALRAGMIPRLVFPHPAFDDEDAVGNQEPMRERPTNALPFAYAKYLAEIVGCERDNNIFQVARVGRTRLNKWLRFLCQPSFGGEVSRIDPYIIVDDVVSTGGTFAALRSYIVREGGTVIATSSLATTSGADKPFAVAHRTVDVLKSLYGDGIERFWSETLGHELQCITEAEGDFVAEFGHGLVRHWLTRGDTLLQRLRNRLNQAAAQGR